MAEQPEITDSLERLTARWPGSARAATKERAEEIARSGHRRRERSLYVYELQDSAEEGELREKK